MAKVLGLDLGTNSIGWAVVEETDHGYSLMEKGVDIFKDGVDHDQSGEKPMVQTRTSARALRRHYFRRRLRKIELLKVLIANKMCPPLSDEMLTQWKSKKIYPLTEDFIQWQRTDDNKGNNPYYCRFVALTQRLDLNKQDERYLLGRALYHLAQRRGFLSNRKDAEKESEDGDVKSGISNLSRDMKSMDCQYLGEYFYKLYQTGKKIRKHYTSRNEHYKKEFDAICARQSLSAGLVKSLDRAIFYQRPLKSQKGLVGKCTFEPSKSRCPESHPAYEEFRKLQFVNNIRVKGPYDTEYRSLSETEREKIDSLFFRKSKPQFDFEDIAKTIAGKGQSYGDKQAKQDVAYRFNYSMSTSVSGCPVTAALKGIFGTKENNYDDWRKNACKQYALSQGKTEDRIIDDIWHVLFSFGNDDCLENWGRQRLHLEGDLLKAFVSIHVSQNYASLSLSAIRKMLPYLRNGYRYDVAVFLANLKSVLPPEVWNDEGLRNEVIDEISMQIEDFHNNPLNRGTTKEKLVRDCLRDDFQVDEHHLDKLYHPSMIEVYQTVLPDKDGVYKLGSPRTSSVRNPMAMRSLFRLRVLLNKLLSDGCIDRNTKINIEFSRDLNDANMRKAIQHYQHDNELKKKGYAEKIKELYKAETHLDIEPTEDDILKYQLWEEQNHRCLYTGNNIGVSDFLGAGTKYDIEHTVPRSMGGDNSQMNKTLCDNTFNRDVKKAKLPSQLSDYKKILARVEELGWEKKIDDLKSQIEKEHRKSRLAQDKNVKDAAIQRKHYLKMELAYWQGKLLRFQMTEVPEGFSNRQGVDVGIIGKYARLYLKTVFQNVYTVKGLTTSEFRKMWGLQDEYAKKERDNHVHHCIDAITIACIGKREYDQWAQYKGDMERYKFHVSADKPTFDKPWPTFTEDVKQIANEILVSHYEPDNMPKQSKKKLRVRGRIQRDANGLPLYAQGDTARGALHLQTFYGAIQREGEIKYVVRKSLSSLKDNEIKNIVDDVVREKVESAIKDKGFKSAMASTIWMNEEKHIPINKVRVYVPGVTHPVELKKHRDESTKEHKRFYYVTNDSNYCMALYEGHDIKDKIKRGYELISNLEASNFYKNSADRDLRNTLVPIMKGDMPLLTILKVGDMVLLYDKTPFELYEATDVELSKRLYKIIGLSYTTVQQKYQYGMITLRHHLEARPTTELNPKKGEWKTGETMRPLIVLNHNQFRGLVEHRDFVLDVTGKITYYNH